MAARKSFAFITTLFCLILSLPYTLSRALSEPPYSTTLLNVSASLQQTKHIIPHAQTTGAKSTITTHAFNSSSLSLNLHPQRPKNLYNDYKTIVLTRLAHDSARVRRHLVGMKANDPSIPVVVGRSKTDKLVFGHYYALVQIGTPPGSFHLTLDTCTDITWLQCDFCHECHHQDDPTFEPSTSSTYKPLSCKSQQCGFFEPTSAQFQCNENKSCWYEVPYSSQCYTSGDFVTETVSFGNFVTQNVALGCGHYQEGFYTSSAGTLGLGAGPLSLPSQIKASSFSFCLVDINSESSSTIEFNAQMPRDSVTAPLLKSNSDTFHHVGLDGISVGGKQYVHVPQKSGIVVDSASHYTWLWSQEYNKLRDAFVKMTAELSGLNKTTKGGDFDTCYELTRLDKVKFPTVSFHFVGGKVLDLPVKNYVVPVDDSGTFCFAFRKIDGPMSFLGNTQLQGIRVSFDLKNSLVGFSPNKC